MRRSILLRAMGAMSAGVVCAGGINSQAGPYAPAAGVAGSTAIERSSSQISAWASAYQDYTVGPNVDLTWQNPSKALGAAEGNAFDIVSLGDGGSITLTFDQPIGDGTGFDFAVFENSFSDTFLELAWVEVSADGNAFLRFDNDSLTPNPVPFIGGSIDPTNVDGLAGKYRQGYGTPFDLASVGLSVATHVRLVDVIGDGSALGTSGNAIYDPHPTVGSGGFDLDALAVLHSFNGLAGDADLDGDVDLSDLGALASNYGQTQNVTWSHGNFDFDSDVDLSDLGALASNYNTGTQQAMIDFRSLTAVPELAGYAPALMLLGLGASLVRRRGAAVCAAAMLSIVPIASATTANIEDVPLAPNSYYNGADEAGGFASAGITFKNDYNVSWQSWSGFAASNVNDATTPGYGNQYAAITGAGVGGSGNYAVGYDPGSPPRIDLNQTVSVDGLFITNATYTYLAVANGDDGNQFPFVRQFGDDPNLAGGGNQGYADYLLLSITGRDANDAPVGTVDFYLSDYRPADNADDYVVDDWQWVDLSSLGSIASLTFAMTSTDLGDWGSNTPMYFAIDDLTIVPEPATTAGMLSALAVVSLRSRSRRARP